MEDKIILNTSIERLRQLFPVKKDGKFKNDFEFAFEKAYTDATNRITRLRQNVDKKALKDGLRDKLSKLYDDYFEDQISFNKLFKEGCRVIDETFKELYTNGNKFGIEQKLINMLFKYLYCYGDVNKEKFNDCYIPIDRYILSWYKRHIGKHGVENDSWSNMSEEKFYTIQENLTDYAKTHYKSSTGGEITRLEMEFYIWQEEQLFQAEDIIRKLAKQDIIKYLPVYDKNEQKKLSEAILSRGSEQL